MYKRRLIILSIIICIFITGCKGKGEKDSQLKQKDKAPQSLQDLSKELNKVLEGAGNIERIGLDIDEVTLKEERDKGKDQEKDNQDNKNKGQVKEQDKGQDKKDKEGQGDKQQKDDGDSNKANMETGDQQQNKQVGKPEKLKETWNSIDKSLEKSHSLWNEYEADRIKKDGSSGSIDRFETSLNKMTKAVEDRNINDIYDFGSQCFLDLKPFYDLHTDEYRGDVSNLKYMVYRYYLSFINKDKAEATRVLRDGDESINRIRTRLEKGGKNEKEKLETLDKVSAGLKGLGNAFDEDSKRLTIIKKDTLINNLKVLE